MPPDTVFFITDVCIPHSWIVVEQWISVTLYFCCAITASDAPPPTQKKHTFYIATMSPGVHGGPGFTAALNNAIHTRAPPVDVAYPGNNKLAINLNIAGNTFKI